MKNIYIANFYIKKVVIYLLLASSIFIPGIIALHNVDQPVGADDLFMQLAAETLFANGSAYFIFPEFQAKSEPLSYNGIFHYTMSDSVLPKYDHHLYMYILLLLFVFFMFGVSPAASRLVGVGSGLLSIVLIYVVLRIYIKGSRERKMFLAAIAALAYGIMPLFINTMSIIDIDTSILLPLCIMMVWAVVSFLKSGKMSCLLGIIISTTLMFWARLSIPSLVIFGILLSLIFVNSSVRDKCRVLMAIALGIMLFIVTWFLYCRVNQINFFGPFTYTFIDRDRAIDYQFFKGLVFNFVWFGMWLGIFFLRSYKHGGLFYYQAI